MDGWSGGEDNSYNPNRPPMVVVAGDEDSKSRARSESNRLAHETRNSGSFHDITVVVTDYDNEEDEGQTILRPSRPTMASSLSCGQWVVSHNSSRGTDKTNWHPAVQDVLDMQGLVVDGRLNPYQDSTGRYFGKMERWHGRCAEVGAVSDYLNTVPNLKGKEVLDYLNMAPKDREWTVDEAREHFKEGDATIFAHRTALSEGTPETEVTAEVPACGSCEFMLTEFGINHTSSSVADDGTYDVDEGPDFDERDDVDQGDDFDEGDDVDEDDY